MTPECPKGQEREARPEEVSLQEHVAEHFRVQWGYAEMNDWLKRCARDAVNALSPELERLTAEVQAQNRLYRKVGAERDEKQFEIERLRRWVDRFRAGLQESRAQVERTRRAERRSIASVLTGMLEELEAAYVLEFGEGPAPSREKLGEVQKFSVDLFATSGPVELDEFESGGPSSEVEAPQQHVSPPNWHPVEVAAHGGGWWKASCVECGVENYTRHEAEARDWKDQHEADTLRPQLQANSKLEQNLDEGRPSGSERLAPRPIETGLVLVSRAELVAGMLVGIGGEHDAVPTQQQLDRAADLIFRSARRRDSTEEGQARLLAVLFDHQCAETGCTDTAADGEVTCSQHLVPDESEQDAAQAARSGATPEEAPGPAMYQEGGGSRG